MSNAKKRKDAQRRRLASLSASSTRRGTEPLTNLHLYEYATAEDQPGDPVPLPKRQVAGRDCLILDLEGPLSTELADLITLQRDLEFARSCMHALNDLAAVRPSLTTDALKNALQHAISAEAEAAYISYGRCFGRGRSAGDPGRRVEIPEDFMNGLTEEERATHELALELRNLHVAHRINDWAQVRVRGVLNPEGMEPSVLDVDTFLFLGVPASTVRADAMIGLINRFIEPIEARRAEIRDALLEQLRSEKIEDVYARAHPQ